MESVWMDQLYLLQRVRSPVSTLRTSDATLKILEMELVRIFDQHWISWSFLRNSGKRHATPKYEEVDLDHRSQVVVRKVRISYTRQHLMRRMIGLARDGHLKIRRGLQNESMKRSNKLISIKDFKSHPNESCSLSACMFAQDLTHHEYRQYLLCVSRATPPMQLTLPCSPPFAQWSWRTS